MTWYRIITANCAFSPRPHDQQSKEDDKDYQQPEIFSLHRDRT
jgi:hypothetical protein